MPEIKITKDEVEKAVKDKYGQGRIEWRKDKSIKLTVSDEAREAGFRFKKDGD